MLLPEILQPGAINETVSRLDVINDRLQTFFEVGGSNPMSGRYFHWDVFDETRNISGGRAPDTGPARIAPQPVGAVNGVFPRVHESVPLSYEKVHNLRQLGSRELDRAGETYIVNQEQILRQRLTNHREFQYMGMMRGGYYYTRTGDDLAVSLTSGENFIDFQIPAGNKNQLNMLGAGDIIGASWALAATDIPADLFQIDKAFEQLVGRPLRHCWLNLQTMDYVLGNDEVKGLSGTANVVFDSFQRIGKNDFRVVLKGIPWLEWHVTNGVLEIDGTTTPLFADDEIMFCPEPDNDIVQLYEGSEVVVEFPGATPAERFGEYFWAEPTTKPAGYELISLYNGIPALKRPKAIAFADVTP